MKLCSGPRRVVTDDSQELGPCRTPSSRPLQQVWLCESPPDIAVSFAEPGFEGASERPTLSSQYCSTCARDIDGRCPQNTQVSLRLLLTKEVLVRTPQAKCAKAMAVEVLSCVGWIPRTEVLMCADVLPTLTKQHI